ncbi:hypothetical protein ACLOJK_004735 [Asimina triloba]
MACRDGLWTSPALETEEGCCPSPWRKPNAAAVRPPCWPSWLLMEPEMEAWPPTRRSAWPAVKPEMMEGDGFVAHATVVWICRRICRIAHRCKLAVTGCPPLALSSPSSAAWEKPSPAAIAADLGEMMEHRKFGAPRCTGVCAHALQKNIQEDVPVAAESANADDQSSGGSPSGEKAKRDVSEFEAEALKKDSSSTEVFDMGRSDGGQNADANFSQANNPNSNSENKDQNSASRERSAMKLVSGRLSSGGEEALGNNPGLQDPPNTVVQEYMALNGNLDSLVSKKKNATAGENEGKSSSLGESNLSVFRSRLQESSPPKEMLYWVMII